MMRNLQYILEVLKYNKVLVFHKEVNRLTYEVTGQDPWYISDAGFRRLEKKYLKYIKDLDGRTEK